MNAVGINGSPSSMRVVMNTGFLGNRNLRGDGIELLFAAVRRFKVSFMPSVTVR